MDQHLALAWHVEIFARMKRLPPLAKVLGRSAQTQMTSRQSNDEILAAMRSWAAVQNAKMEGEAPCSEP
ncbi:hypothetical protein KNJ79_02040 [Sphingopyxis indica]|uniref:hypothetical protein n=1 Tax=Sphingopyxis indica TaxID=436663 RepID=UPI0029393809|nr:hypothetical protein [Sphingopyxis indica]WOF43768.1 hypothetical protein KNJ79_02040 [Sphingopyxis indica]